MIKAADMLIARRADTKARTDFATWKMMAKLNGADTLPVEAQHFLASYKALLDKTAEPEATDTTINLMYRAYYAEMGGHGTPPDIRAHLQEPVTDNVTAFKRPSPQRSKNKGGASGKPRLPVALIFACLVVVYVGFRYFWR
ncbi:hypothetical protein [Bradyrhizobium sp. dw_78]|uniref:hypothetical protein n=1 Tax=Bradyrhizobium sp. dw_78 TaxID=2719793 RepID=UPI00201CA9D8|nr:hypothetical protein [Bradyrhizobium sp. dw_78]